MFAAIVSVIVLTAAETPMAAETLSPGPHAMPNAPEPAPAVICTVSVALRSTSPLVVITLVVPVTV